MNIYPDLFLTFAKVGVMTFGGIRVCVCILILNAVVKLYKKAVIDAPTAVIFLAVALGSYFTPLSPVIFVLAAGIAGIVLKNAGVKK